MHQTLCKALVIEQEKNRPDPSLEVYILMRESGHKHENMQMNEIIWNVINAIKKI